MKSRRTREIFPRVSNPLKYKYLVRCAWCVVGAALLACGAPKTAEPPAPQAPAPIPATNLSGQRVMVLPFTLVAADDSLGWRDQMLDRRQVIARCDSILGTLLTERAPEAQWALPLELRHVAQRSAGMVGDPGQFPSSLLRFESIVDVPDPLRSQLRNLAAVGGGRWVLVPAALVYRKTVGQSESRTGKPAPAVEGTGAGTAELSLVIVDTRMGKVHWRTVSRGAGDDPWTALTRAVKAVTPGLP